MNQEQTQALQAEIDRLKAENQALNSDKAKAGSQIGGSETEKALSIKVSEKGAISVYGLGRFPVTLYPNQWRRLMGVKGDVINFVETALRNGTVKEKPTKEDGATPLKATV